MSSIAFLVAAYAAVGLSLLVYGVVLARRRARLTRELARVPGAGDEGDFAGGKVG
ncbi:MAG: CcmD family protein [Chloroflexota bacterium]